MIIVRILDQGQRSCILGTQALVNESFLKLVKLQHLFTNAFSEQFHNSSVIRQKGNLKTGVSRKQSTPKFPKNKHFLPPDTHTFLIPLSFLNISLNFSLQLSSLCSDILQSGAIVSCCHQLENYHVDELISFHALHSFD